ncbi:protein yippee-like At5g53940 isoform X2 [Asparagus officinalis]|uniref:protein yippee-like At5g53940 isoform X2 n=1 Tax=Asparagus officinalis TaxID=4686 RepID=UPI00098DE8CE|nr:protein yippee-like At5g53940 isoform X2 [Asparagus officinalis]
MNFLWFQQKKAFAGKKGVNSNPFMGRIFTVELDGRIYRCRFCHTHLALAEDIISRSFHCRRGKAYLFNNVFYGVGFLLYPGSYSQKHANISVGSLEERMMLSGMHTVADIFCCCCGQNVGWKYEAAHLKSQKYKEGKFVLERGRIVDGVDSEFYINTNLNGSDPDD